MEEKFIAAWAANRKKAEELGGTKEPESGRQEYLQSIINSILFK